MLLKSLMTCQSSLIIVWHARLIGKIPRHLFGHCFRVNMEQSKLALCVVREQIAINICINSSLRSAHCCSSKTYHCLTVYFNVNVRYRYWNWITIFLSRKVYTRMLWREYAACIKQGQWLFLAWYYFLKVYLLVYGSCPEYAYRPHCR